MFRHEGFLFSWSTTSKLPTLVDSCGREPKLWNQTVERQVKEKSLFNANNLKSCRWRHSTQRPVRPPNWPKRCYWPHRPVRAPLRRHRRLPCPSAQASKTRTWWCWTLTWTILLYLLVWSTAWRTMTARAGPTLLTNGRSISFKATPKLSLRPSFVSSKSSSGKHLNCKFFPPFLESQKIN